MNERIKQFLTMEGLTPARFADIMGIQRSGISHLLSGRNKPSCEFIQKILTAYPNLNAEWLLLGKGKPYKEFILTDSTKPFVENTQVKIATDLFDTLEDLPAGEIDDLPTDDTLEQHFQEPLNMSDNMEVESKIDNPELSENSISSPISIPYEQKSQKKISRITVFFSNGTFEER